MGEFVNGFNGGHPLGMDTSNPGNPDSRSSTTRKNTESGRCLFPRGDIASGAMGETLARQCISLDASAADFVSKRRDPFLGIGST